MHGGCADEDLSGGSIEGSLTGNRELLHDRSQARELTILVGFEQAALELELAELVEELQNEFLFFGQVQRIWVRGIQEVVFEFL